jgi:hypothetical protein
MGGLELLDLRTEMGLSQSKLLRNAIFFRHRSRKNDSSVSQIFSDSTAGATRTPPRRAKHSLALSYTHMDYWSTAASNIHIISPSRSQTVSTVRLQGRQDRCIMQQKTSSTLHTTARKGRQPGAICISRL